ncbi:uncharacterized protein FA14DRAFT_158176 [Meira miltonrushii]|uniref:Uncharacterized protein n=1 Tax=Meira miltonrushii TaxID=1280837 RepID=A0A316V460_9BASI|nr:uncharacterized protein FA14DRAFT_158176 [Meira miltonrushii]PWN32242.1 hypothetical protein FA14DRAFT_158176 [Meira miltonrushii]
MLFIRLVIFLAICAPLATTAPSCLGINIPKKVRSADKAAHLEEQKSQRDIRTNEIARSERIIDCYHDKNSEGAKLYKSDIVDRQKSLKRIERNIKALESGKIVTHTTQHGADRKTYRSWP